MSNAKKNLEDQIELLERSIHIAEKSNFTGGITLVDENGDIREHITFNRDTTRLREALASSQKRLASIG